MRCTIIATAVLLAATGCEGRSAEQAAGAVRIRTEIEHATLYVDARERGALHDGMEVRLSVGPHVLEARRDDVVLAAAIAEAQAARIFDVELAARRGPGGDESADPDDGALEAPTRERERPASEASLDDALGSERPIGDAPSTDVEVDEGLPETPSRSDVVRAMAAVSEQVSACGGGWTGLAPVRAVFGGPSGQAAEVTVTGSAVPPAVRSCIAQAVRQARVPPFSRSTFTVNYPFRV